MQDQPQPATGDPLQPEGGWNTPQPARLRPPPLAERGLLFRAVSGFARSFGRSQLPDIFSVLHINARLFWAWLFFASRLMPGGRLPAREREKVILRTAWLCRSRYEWGQHVDLALRAGVTDAEIVQLARDPDAVEGHERTLLRACDELVAQRCVGDATWAALAGHYDERRLIEIVMLVGHYVMVAGFLNSAGLQLEASIEARLQAFHRRIADS